MQPVRQVHPAPLDLPGLPEVPLARPDLLAQLAQPERQARLVQREPKGLLVPLDPLALLALLVLRAQPVRRVQWGHKARLVR